MDKLQGAALDAAVARALGHAEGAITYSMPSFATQLQREHGIAVYPNEKGDWVAGFDLRWHPENGIELDHAARGDTPEEAICRCVVVRAEAIRAQAWERAEETRRTRKARTSGFANETERAAYIKALDDQRELVKQQNPKLYPGGES
jgi:hypothetical protein